MSNNKNFETSHGRFNNRGEQREEHESHQLYPVQGDQGPRSTHSFNYDVLQGTGEPLPGRSYLDAPVFRDGRPHYRASSSGIHSDEARGLHQPFLGIEDHRRSSSDSQGYPGQPTAPAQASVANFGRSWTSSLASLPAREEPLFPPRRIQSAEAMATEANLTNSRQQQVQTQTPERTQHIPSNHPNPIPGETYVGAFEDQINRMRLECSANEEYIRWRDANLARSHLPDNWWWGVSYTEGMLDSNLVVYFEHHEQEIYGAPSAVQALYWANQGVWRREWDKAKNDEDGKPAMGDGRSG